jgi:hypothetical protein
MGYRGSKSEILSIPIPNRISVKEQRVDGSYCTNININIKNLQLRCTLMDFERYYQTSLPSKQINRTFRTLELLELLELFLLRISNLPCFCLCPIGQRPETRGSIGHKKLNPWFVTGFIDAEGTFCTTIYKNKAYKTGWVVRSFLK